MKSSRLQQRMLALSVLISLCVPLAASSAHDLEEVHPALGRFARLEPFSVTLFGHTVSSGENGGLVKTRVQENEGHDAHGPFHETLIDWDAKSWPRRSDEVYFQTSIKVYVDFHQQRNELQELGNSTSVEKVEDEASVVAVVFSQRYPQGAADTDNTDCESTFDLNGDGHSSASSPPSLRSTFPTLNFDDLHYFSYKGCFLRTHDMGQFPTDEPKHNLTDGIEAGPLLLFEPKNSDDDDDNHHATSGGRCAILSHYNEFMTQTTLHNHGSSTVSLGPMGSICVLPKNYEAKTVLVMSNRPSIQDAVEQWGKMLRNEHMGTPPHNKRIHDVDYTTRY